MSSSSSSSSLSSSSPTLAQMWPQDVGVLLRWPDLLDFFPGWAKSPAHSYNALTRLVLYSGGVMFYFRRDWRVLTGVALLMLYMFGQQDKYAMETFWINRRDMRLLDEVAPEPDSQEVAVKTEAQRMARRILENPRDIGSRPAIVPTPDDKFFAHRPVRNDWSHHELPSFMDGKVGAMKSVAKLAG